MKPLKARKWRCHTVTFSRTYKPVEAGRQIARIRRSYRRRI